MDRYYMPVSREEDDSIDHQYKVYDYSTNDYQRTTQAKPSKMKTKFWLGKQQLRQKLGKEEDAWVVKGDSSLDAKLSYYHHVNDSCNELLLLCERLQHHMKGLSLQEMLLGKFLDARSKHESTEAGKMMSYIGYAEEYMSKKRNSLYPSITRLMTDLGVFQQKAVQDCSFTVDRMEQCRTEFRASLLWLDNISQQLNPEDREQLEKFRKVQALTRDKRVEFARMKDNTIQKIEILAASRVNLLSARLEEYHLATQKFLQSSIKALQEVVAAKERLDVKIEEKRIADLEAEIDAHNPSKKSAKLLSSDSYSEQAAEENGEGSKTTQPPKLKDLQHQPMLSDDEDLVNLHDDFGDFETAEPKPSSDVFEQTETLDEIFGRLSPAHSMPEDTEMDLIGLGGLSEEKKGEGAGKGAIGGGLVGDHPSPSDPASRIPEGVDWFSNLQNQDSSDNQEEGLDWTMMNDLLTQSDNDLLSAPATDQDMLQLSAALANLDTGFQDKESEPPQSSDEKSTENSTAEGAGPPDKLNIPNKNQMQPQQFNAWLNLFSELDPIAQSKSGNVA
ncbi:hypothetical protein ACHWQZ_G009660 [Mnemiopsis leidyi]